LRIQRDPFICFPAALALFLSISPNRIIGTDSFAGPMIISVCLRPIWGLAQKAAEKKARPPTRPHTSFIYATQSINGTATHKPPKTQNFFNPLVTLSSQIDFCHAKDWKTPLISVFECYLGIFLNFYATKIVKFHITSYTNMALSKLTLKSCLYFKNQRTIFPRGLNIILTGKKNSTLCKLKIVKD